MSTEDIAAIISFNYLVFTALIQGDEGDGYPKKMTNFSVSFGKSPSWGILQKLGIKNL